MDEFLDCSIGLIYNQQLINSKKNKLIFLKRNKSPYKDMYELPGGKIEDGETPKDALIRELYEEIGVEKSQIISIKEHPNFIHHYDNLKVRLHIFSINISDNSSIISKENKELKYLDPLYDDEKYLESTYRIIRLLKLDRKISIINIHDEKTIDNNVARKMYRNNKTIRLRNTSSTSNHYINLLMKYNDEVKNLKKLHSNNLIIDIPELDSTFSHEQLREFNGIHYNSKILNHLTKDKLFIRHNHLNTISASCHNIHEIQIANKLNLDFIFLSPVLSKNHSNEILGWESFKKLVNIAHMPVFALGGLKDNEADMSSSIKYGGYGISGIRYF